jgi:hypothetical protein
MVQETNHIAEGYNCELWINCVVMLKDASCLVTVGITDTTCAADSVVIHRGDDLINRF